MLFAGVFFHEEEASLGEVVDVKEFSKRSSATPTSNRMEVVAFGFMVAAEHGRQDVRVVGVVVVVGAIQVRGHR